jgi:4-hydroxy-tetrahydrodipicolinate synthase
MFEGLYTAVITPFTKNGDIDLNALGKILEFQISSGVDGVVVCGTTGESATLSEGEQDTIISHSVKVVNSRIKVIAGTGSNCTIKAIRLTQNASKHKIDGVLSVVPYYNKPTQEGIYEHFKAIHDNTNTPIILYNVPGRTVTNMSDETIANLAKLQRIISLKDATGDLARVYTLKYELEKHNITKKFTLISGEDMTAVSFNASGGCGLISVVSNVVPDICAKIQKLSLKQASLQQNIAEANKLQHKLTNLNRILFLQSNPIPVKYAMHLMSYCESYTRLPLTQPTQDIANLIKNELQNLNIL